MMSMIFLTSYFNRHCLTQSYLWWLIGYGLTFKMLQQCNLRISDSTDVWFPTKIKFPEECSGLLNHQDNTIYPNHCNPFHSEFCKSMNKHWLRLSILQKLSNAYNPEAEIHQFPENHYNHGFKIDYRSHLYTCTYIFLLSKKYVLLLSTLL